MEEKNTREETPPSGSKKENESVSGEDNERKKYDGKTDLISESNSFSSGGSVRSRIDIADGNPEIHKLPITKRLTKRYQRKNRDGGRSRRPARRAEKRRRSLARRRVIRKAPKRKPRKTELNLSTSSVYTRLSGTCSSRVMECKYCGRRSLVPALRRPSNMERQERQYQKE